MESIEEYKKAVEFLAAQKKDFDIHNEGNECAKVIFSNIFLNAKHIVRIAANTLRNEVVDSPEYQNALDSFLGKKDSKLQIIINHIPENASETTNFNIYRRMFLNPAYSEGRIHIKSAGRDLFKLGETPANFCVADSIMSRVENDIEKRTALCNFGNTTRANKLEVIFDNGFNNIEKEVDLNQLFS